MIGPQPEANAVLRGHGLWASLPRVCGELLVGDRLTRSLSALTFSGSCSRSSGVSGISVRLGEEEEAGRRKKGEREGEEADAKKPQNTADHLTT